MSIKKPIETALVITKECGEQQLDNNVISHLLLLMTDELQPLHTTEYRSKASLGF
jgi:hypothetical protein